jgi:16S rRNA (cytosine967-C5)-methyltransferase
MKISSLIGHVTELYSFLSNWEKPADNVIKEFYKSRKYLGSKDRKYISETTYGLIRNHRLLDNISKTILSGKIEINYYEGLIFIANILSGQKDELVNNHFKETIPNCVEISSIVDTEIKLQSKDPYLKYSFPDWMKSKIEMVIGPEEIEEFFFTLNMPAPISIRLVDKNEEKELETAFRSKGVSLLKSRLAPHAYRISKRVLFSEMDSFVKGNFEVQDEGSQLVTLFTGAKGNMKILDACAGGGGKSLYLSTMLDNDGLVYAYDNDIKRLEMFKKRIKGKKYHNIRIIDSIEELERLGNIFDIVVLDAPCSGSGTLRRNPDLKWRLKESDLKSFSDRQLQILKDYARFTKPGGKIVYITCSFFKEENENVISQFLSDTGSYSFCNMDEYFDNFNIKPSENFLRLYTHKHDTDGFTACCLKRNF